MIKKTWVLSVAVALIVLGLCTTPCLAQSTTNVSKKGSLLIFPKIVTESGTDTIITIGNDYPDAVLIKCFWMDSTQQSWDFEFTLTAYQPIWFAASTGVGTVEISGFGEGKAGELKCWAIKELPDPANPGSTIEKQISWNHLYGTALFIDFTSTTSFEYNAFAFAASGSIARGDPVGTPGTLLLDGSSFYDACPSYLIFNFFAENNLAGGLGQDDGLALNVGQSDLALAPCKQDLRQDATPICSKVKFDIWNENEAKLTGAYQCVKCWFEGVLSRIGLDIWEECDLASVANGKCKPTGVGGKKFTLNVLKTDMGRFRVSPDTFTACNGVFAQLGQDGKTPVDVCTGNVFKTPFVGVLISQILNAGDPKDYVTTPTGAGVWNAGDPTQPIPAILWDPGLGTSPAAKR